jgi:hypothetical protein
MYRVPLGLKMILKYHINHDRLDYAEQQRYRDVYDDLGLFSISEEIPRFNKDGVHISASMYYQEMARYLCSHRPEIRYIRPVEHDAN